MEIELSRGRVTVIDDCDWDMVRGFRWVAQKSGCTWYAVCHYYENGKKRTTMLHRMLCGLSLGDRLQVDHRDGDGLNNRRSNLRICTHADNTKNRKRAKHNSTGYKSVFKERGRFRARISIDGKKLHLGMFDCAEEAFAAYKRAALLYHGEFACFGEHAAESVGKTTGFSGE